MTLYSILSLTKTGTNQVIEYVRFGIGMRLQVSVEDGVLVLCDKGYVWRLFGVKIPIPLGLLLGRDYVEERALDDSSFSMKMEITHPWFGVMFRYRGRFQLPEVSSSAEPSE